MKKFLLSGAVVVLFALYVAFLRDPGATQTITVVGSPQLPKNSGSVADSSGSTQTSGSAPSGGTTTKKPSPQPVPTPPPAPAPAPKPSGAYVDGSYTGSVADAFYGLVQVKAVIQGGRVADVQFLQYPSDRSTSREINGQAMPMLTSEAIQAQNANVDIISGATATSGAFRESLAAALAAAKA